MNPLNARFNELRLKKRREGLSPAEAEELRREAREYAARLEASRPTKTARRKPAPENARFNELNRKRVREGLSADEELELVAERKAYQDRARAADPTLAERRLAGNRASAAKRKQDPEKYAAYLEGMREWNRKVGWQGKDPEAYRARKRAYMKMKRHTDSAFRAVHYLRTRTRNAAVRQGADANRRKRSSASHALGCSYNELRAYLESKFAPGMTWDNAGKWHIDHIMPLASFDLLDPDQFAKAAHYTNLQPLWAIDNYRKGARLPGTTPRTPQP